jgi:hypothetical protein
MEKEERRTMKIGEKKQVTISAWKRKPQGRDMKMVTELTYLGKFNGKPRYESQTKHIVG